MLCMGSLTNYRVSDHHTSPAPCCKKYIHSLPFLLLLHTHIVLFLPSLALHPSPRHLHQSQCQSHSIFDSPALVPKALLALKGTTGQLQNEAKQQTPTYILCSRQALFSIGIIWSHQKTQTAPAHSSISSNTSPGPAFGPR